MINNSEESKPSEQNERYVYEYFIQRGWSVTKLDTGNQQEQAADFQISDPAGCCFLCEVKTIESVRANFPSKPYDSYREERKRRQDEIKKWAEENPGKRLILGAEDIRHKKPAPDIYLKAAKKLKISPKECIVVEDAPNGIIAAKAAGMICIAVTTTFQHSIIQKEKPDFICNDLFQVYNQIKEITL